jgi:hypothetical protein
MKSPGLVVVFILSSAGVIAQNGNEVHGQVAQELVGKWCFISQGVSTLENMSNSCITLNADGSYEIHLDAAVKSAVSASFPGLSETDYGTWGVQDGRMYYNSSAHGEGSFRLQKLNHPRIESTPTIVLDGVVFVTANPRDPW